MSSATDSGATERPLPSKFLSASPFVPSYMRGSGGGDEPTHLEAPFASPPEEPAPPRSSPVVDDSAPLNASPTSMTMGQYSNLLQLLPDEVQDLLQVNLSHLQATNSGSLASEAEMRFRAATATFDQLSMDQMLHLNEAWHLVFGEEEGEVEADPQAVFTYKDQGLLPEEEEWFMQQMLHESVVGLRRPGNAAPRGRNGGGNKRKKGPGK